MKKKLHKKFKLSKLNLRRASMLLFAFFMAMTAITALTIKASAAAALIYLEPDTVSVQKNNNFTLEIRIDTSEQNVDGVDIKLDYETTNLQYVSTSTSGSAFGAEIVAPSGGGGNVKMTLGTFNSANGDVLIAKVTFKALVDSGDSLVVVDNASNAISGPAYINPDKQDANIVFTQPPTQPKPDENKTTTKTPTTSTTKPRTNSPSTSTNTSPDSNNNTSTSTPVEDTPNQAVPDYYNDLSSTNTSSSTPKVSSNNLLTKLRTPMIIAGATLAIIFGALFVASMLLHKNSFGELVGIFKRRHHEADNVSGSSISIANQVGPEPQKDAILPEGSIQPADNVIHPGDNPNTPPPKVEPPSNQVNSSTENPQSTEPKIIKPDSKDTPS